MIVMRSIFIAFLVFIAWTANAWADHLRVVYTRPGGPVSIINPAPEFVARFQTEMEALNALVADVPLGASNVEIIDKVALPNDRWFREAWVQLPGGGPIEIDMPKARVIQAEKIQAARRPEIDRLRNEEDKARLQGQTANANQHAADRASLEAMNFAAVAASIAGAANPTALKAIWPVGLPPQ